MPHHDTYAVDAPPFDAWFPDAPFDASYGYDLAALRAVEPPPGPHDFDEFWTSRFRRAAAMDPEPVLGPPTRHGNTDVAPVRLTSSDGVRVGGWFTRPAAGPTRRALVVSHGYGGRLEPDLSLFPPDTAALFVVARGLPGPSLIPGIPPTGAEHVLHGIESRDRYVHGGCAADVWCAASALLQLVPESPGRLGFIGTSFGGGIGALAVPWDDRFGAAVLRVPSFGHHPLRLTMPCTGSGESVRRYAVGHPDVVDVLAYFDAATAAARLRIPALMGPALWDPSVPPPGQFAVANAPAAGEVETYVFSAGHAEYPGAQDELDVFVGRSTALFRRHLDP